jgi:hypothetical protein
MQTTRYSSPRTILGFLGFIVTILATTTVIVVAILARTASLRYLIPIVLIVFLVLVISIVLWVITIGRNNPAKLQLREITGQEYILIQQATLGDSKAGEHVANVILPIADETVSPELPQTQGAKAIPEVKDNQSGQRGEDEGEEQ